MIPPSPDDPAQPAMAPETADAEADADAGRGAWRGGEPQVAVIVPCLNDAAALAGCLAAAGELGCELVVSDGGSTDGSLELARQAGATTVTGAAGRGPQLNRGAAATAADILLFLHADTRLPAEALALVRQAVRDGADGGAFWIRFDDPRRLMRLAAFLINLRTRWTGVPLGDQAQFVTRDTFDRLRGFQDWPILEDLDFMRRLQRIGKVIIVPGTITTGARRFNQRGVVRTVATNWLILVLYLCGVSPHRLARLYRPVR
jgi:rSAM/selenodomain-associated transferase 2